MEDEEGIGSASIPLEMKKLRACLRCSLIKTVDQFYDEGCENCPFLRLDGQLPRVMEATTAYYEGMIALVSPEGSWVARWQRIEKSFPGLYAISVVGELSDDLKDICREEGAPFRAEIQNSK
jgi:transcription elongation factor SPT4